MRYQYAGDRRGGRQARANRQNEQTQTFTQFNKTRFKLIWLVVVFCNRANVGLMLSANVGCQGRPMSKIKLARHQHPTWSQRICTHWPNMSLLSGYVQIVWPSAPNYWPPCHGQRNLKLTLNNDIVLAVSKLFHTCPHLTIVLLFIE